MADVAESEDEAKVTDIVDVPSDVPSDAGTSVGAIASASKDVT